MKFFKLWVPVIVWAMAIFFMSSNRFRKVGGSISREAKFELPLIGNWLLVNWHVALKMVGIAVEFICPADICSFNVHRFPGQRVPPLV